MPQFNVRVAVGATNSRFVNVLVTANNQRDAERAAASQTGGTAKGSVQTSSKK
jgi:hypothetical protein